MLTLLTETRLEPPKEDEVAVEGSTAALRLGKLQRAAAERKTPTAELLRMERRQMHSVLQRAEEGVSMNADVLGWLTPWLQQDLLVPLASPGPEV